MAPCCSDISRAFGTRVVFAPVVVALLCRGAWGACESLRLSGYPGDGGGSERYNLHEHPAPDTEPVANMTNAAHDIYFVLVIFHLCPVTYSRRYASATLQKQLDLTSVEAHRREHLSALNWGILYAQTRRKH